jgi:hypothetical protein
MKLVKWALFIIVLILTSCNKSSFEPEIATDICIDTFSPQGGTTVTILPGEPIIIPEIPIIIIMVDSTIN